LLSRLAQHLSTNAQREVAMDFNIGMALWLWILLAPIVGALIFSGGR
jgi:bacteriorhodopsin